MPKPTPPLKPGSVVHVTSIDAESLRTIHALARPYSPVDAALAFRGSIPIGFKLISKSNHKGRGRYLPKKYRDFEGKIAALTVASKKLCEGLEKPLKSGWVVIRPGFQTRVHCDLNNLPKSIMDGLKKGGLFTDDKDWAVTVTPASYGKGAYSVIEIWG